MRWLAFAVAVVLALLALMLAAFGGGIASDAAYAAYEVCSRDSIGGGNLCMVVSCVPALVAAGLSWRAMGDSPARWFLAALLVTWLATVLVGVRESLASAEALDRRCP